MDLNLVVLCGRLAVEPELKSFGSGARLLRLLVTIRSDWPRRRVDVVPVTLWDPPDELVDELPVKGQRIWVCGSAQRRFWEAFERCLSGLSGTASRVFFRREVLGDETEAICREEGITPANCWVILHRARISLRGCLEMGWFGKAADGR